MTSYNIRPFYQVYPLFSVLTDAMFFLPWSARSLLVKVCQAQCLPTTGNLYILIRDHLDVPVAPPGAGRNKDQVTLIPLLELFMQFELDFTDPYVCACVLDIARGAPSDGNLDKDLMIKCWNKEISLAFTPKSPEVNFRPFFFRDSTRHIHPLVPINPPRLEEIRVAFEIFRERIRGSTMYSRYTHKNMSWDTRRQAELMLETDLPQADLPIFGQDDWIQVYHDHGLQIPGVVEMRQKWYPSTVKPRTYFAMGGTTYASSRFLQNFFTQLTSIFPETERRSRLRPQRLVAAFDHSYFRIYDLSSFTSNFQEQSKFMECFVEFFRDVLVTIVDERDGPQQVDLSDLLRQYWEDCVEQPLLSLERTPESLGVKDLTSVPHLRASLLGIFGNLMTCTVAHFLLLSPLTQNSIELNVAGDDGIITTEELTEPHVMNAISVVGECAWEKTFHSWEEGAIHLKRPIYQMDRTLILGDSLSLPVCATMASFLSGDSVSPRYYFMQLEGMTRMEALHAVGQELLRSILQMARLEVSAEDANTIYVGWCKVAESTQGINPKPGCGVPPKSYTWPLSPLSYNYAFTHPIYALSAFKDEEDDFPLYESYSEIDPERLRYSGDELLGNMHPRLRLLKTLGYIEAEPQKTKITRDAWIRYMLSKYSKTLQFLPPVYRFTVVKDVPGVFVF